MGDIVHFGNIVYVNRSFKQAKTKAYKKVLDIQKTYNTVVKVYIVNYYNFERKGDIIHVFNYVIEKEIEKGYGKNFII